MQKRALGWAIVVCAIGSGCGGDGFGDGFGATPGGVKDLTLARELIAAGRIPPADALLVEAMFAEHDLPLDGPACERTLCLRAAAGLAPEIAGAARGWAQVGLSSTIDPETWTRPSTTFVLTVDVSGSMGWGNDDAGTPTPGTLSRELLHALARELRPDDQVAIVTYGSDVSTALALTAGDDSARIHEVIDRLDEDGATNMEAGMRRAYSIGRDASGTEQVRVIVFTDVQPNVGADTPTEFQQMVTDAAAGDVYTTVLALGLGIGPEVMRAMASMRGANAFGLVRTDDVGEFMADQYPWFTTPIAHELAVDVVLDTGWSIDRGLGFPAADDDAEIGLEAGSVFLSRRRGALLVALAPAAEQTAALSGRFTLRYREPDGTVVQEQAAFAHDGSPLDDRGQWFAQPGVARTTALALFTEGMHDAAAVYADDPEQAEAIMRAAQERFAGDVEALASDDLAAEVELGATLLGLIEQRAGQGSLYGP